MILLALKYFEQDRPFSKARGGDGLIEDIVLTRNIFPD
jgi:hypothetical protein